ncbi:hypothetical protein D3C85_1925330 [compost metagenome]
MAISPFLSLTTITRVEMMLNAATATISSSSRPIMAFSMRIAWYRLPWVRVQSRA